MAGEMSMIGELCATTRRSARLHPCFHPHYFDVAGSVILALFLAGYLGQQYLPPPKPRVVGLDLGTTFCSVGVFHPGSGEVEVIADEEGRRSIPSAVSFTPTAVLAGHEAVDLADSNAQNTVYDAKRFIGKIFEPELLEQESSRYPFKVGRLMHPFSVTNGYSHNTSIPAFVYVFTSNNRSVVIYFSLEMIKTVQTTHHCWSTAF